MSPNGGANGFGAIFSMNLDGSGYTRNYDFDNTNGATPYGSLMQASNGKLYGMTSGGGSYGYGVLFSFDPSSNTFSKLVDFNRSNGSESAGSLMQATNGKLYGMNWDGGHMVLVLFSALTFLRILIPIFLILMTTMAIYLMVLRSYRCLMVSFME